MAVRPVALLYPIMAALPAVIPLATLVAPASLTNSDMAEIPRNLFPLHSPPSTTVAAVPATQVTHNVAKAPTFQCPWW